MSVIKRELVRHNILNFRLEAPRERVKRLTIELAPTWGFFGI